MKNEKVISKYFSKLGEKGAKKRWENKTTEEKREHAMKMVEARNKNKSVDKSKKDNETGHLTT